ncbi:MAG: hypothetical protein ABW321_18980, partial [Polyangiales bacterium]
MNLRVASLVCCVVCVARLVCGCGTGQAPLASSSPAHVPQPTAAEAREALPAELSRLNAEARAGAVNEQVAGLAVDDPYRSLESDTPQTQAWLKAQSDHTEQVLAAYRDPKAEERLTRLLEIGTLGEIDISSAAKNPRVFFTLREHPRERPALYMIDLTAPLEAGVLRAAPPLVDPKSFGERAAIDYMVPSHSGRYVALGVSDNGDERSTLRVFDVEQKKLLPDAIGHAKWSRVTWLDDDTGLFYTRYPKPGEPSWNEREPDGYNSWLYAHKLGQPVDSDPLVFKGDKPTDFVGATLDDTGRYAVLSNRRSWTANDLWLWDRGAPPAKRGLVPPANKLVPLVRDLDKRTFVDAKQGQLYLTTNIDAPKQRVVKVDIANAGDHTRWKTVIPEGDAAIEDVIVTEQFIVVHRLRDVQSRLELYSQEGELLGEIGLPGIGALSALTGSHGHDHIAFVWSSLLHAPALFTCDLDTRQVQPLYEVQHDFDSSSYELQQASVAAGDGPHLNRFLTRKKGPPPAR